MKWRVRRPIPLLPVSQSTPASLRRKLPRSFCDKKQTEIPVSRAQTKRLRELFNL